MNINPDPEPKTWADIDKLIGPIEWEWPLWLSKGFLTVIAAESGEGKSAVLLKVAASFINCNPFPDNSPYTGQPGCCLWCETEAAQAIHLERAKLWGILLDKFYAPLDDPLMDIRLDDVDHAAAIVTMAKRPEVLYIVIDSLRGGHNKDENKSGDMAKIGKWLAELAREINKPIVISQLLNKRSRFESDEVTLDRVSGSTAIIQFARMVWAIDTPDTQHKEKKRLSVIKSNLAKFPKAIGFTFTDKGFQFGDAPQAPKTESQLDKAMDLLLIWLAKDAVKSEILEEKFVRESISWRTANTAKSKLKIKPFKKADGWYWGLPAPEDTIDDD
jgi:hypothetical protein